jgi:hypothetical protein
VAAPTRAGEVAETPPQPRLALAALAARPLLWPALLLGALGLGYAGVTGLAALAEPRAPSPWVDPRWFSFEIHQLALIAISLAGVGYGVRGALRALAELEASGRVSAEEARALAAEVLAANRRELAAVGAGALVFCVALSFYPPVWTSGVTPPFFSPWRLWFILRLATTLAVALTWALTLLRLGTRLAAAAARAPLDLLDARAFDPLVRAAGTNLALWVAYLALLGFILVFPSPLELSLLFLALAGLISAAVFVRPLLLIHRVLVATRAREVESAHAAVRRARGAGGAPAPPGALADALAWEARVAGTRTWPVDAGGLARLGLYAAIGLASWVGAALVERVLGALLG